MKSKRFIGFLLTALMIFSLCPVSSFAAGQESGQNYDVDSEDLMAIVIRDGDGNIVETYQLTRQLYVNGTQFTIPANGDLRTYQYHSSIAFYSGFYFVHPDYSDYATTRDRSVTITIRNASSVGGTRRDVIKKTFSTNEEDNTSSPYYHSDLETDGTAIFIESMADSSRPYYDTLYKNNSASSLTISLLVGRD